MAEMRTACRTTVQPRGVPLLKQDDDPELFCLDPLLKVAKPNLKFARFFLISFPLYFGRTLYFLAIASLFGPQCTGTATSRPRL
jgi:hypothetical protein